MVDLAHALRDGLQGAVTDYKVAVLKDSKGLIEPGDPAAIVSKVPYAVLDEGSDAFAGRRRKLRLERGNAHVALRARSRPAPTDPEGRMFFRFSTDYRNRRVPVCCADPGTRTIRLLVELGTAEIVSGSGDEPVEVLVDALFSEPLGFIMDGPEEVWVGPEVERQVRSLLKAQPNRRRALLESELSYLERMAPTGILPRALTERIGMLKRALLEPAKRRKTATPATEDAAKHEVSRLERLIASRAFGTLRFAEREVTGLINPRRVEEGWGLRPLIFRLRLEGSGYRPVLHLWNASRTTAGRERARCLGDGDLIIREFAEDGDIYAMLDLVLNFVETNLVGAVSLEGIRPRRSFRNFVASLF